MKGQFGKPVKEMLDRKFDMIIDPSGKVLMIQPEKLDTVKMDERMAIITNLLKDILDITQPPKKGTASIFRVLPENEIAKGGNWSDTIVNPGLRSIMNYTIADITDTTIIINVTGNSATVSKAEMMGNETTTTMNNKISGKIIVDKATGVFKEKNLLTESNGTTESAFGNLPVTAKTTTVITLNPKQ